ncbi:hypothetical protein METBIDRAFT_58436 [Metschnikowia bicuspidata var. bicuspidata NRRL YB-4993]|uniref:WKF domain-containing protein n=1 Tax=Metschnikowia bicuspidata var. bicuspidata NRRL YB-4993 TaxID=869754 RepID=A0A1A0H701_9ASCO|nr:hypothetical protein METBIDRAFT_58436 [Metschnikowia bicuspidata var. bicuspidata NRRL YB-4993]OBA19735.1 hypothetical protein METBIDRAFT_58436 [Metschnikowia bicuspidata var. bicuspidata NRRL YB-4993]
MGSPTILFNPTANMSKVPAWKRLGLKVKSEVTDDTFSATTHFDGSAITNKVAKKLNKKRQLEEDKNDKTKKPPKRVKKPKTERGPPPEKDQLLYLRQFVLDKENWKFSKQKQNWLLKNIESVPDSYENDLIAYFEEIQGGARTRVETDLRAVIDKWNDYSKRLEEKINAELYGGKAENAESKSEEGAKENVSKTETEAAPSKEYALRCKKLLSAMLDEPVHVEGEDQDLAAPDTPEPSNTESKEPSLASDSKIEPEAEDNLIIEDVESLGAGQEPSADNHQDVMEADKQGSKTETKQNKKDKKSKKEKKTKK